jgi:ribosomal-protein-serine acetyltransferase
VSDPLYLEIGDDAFVRTFTLDDAPTVFALVDAERDRLRRWMPWVDGTETVEDQRRWIERSIASEHDREANGIWLTEGSLAGTIGMSVNALENGGEIGYWLGTPYEGRGLVTRACAAMLDLAFGKLQLHRVTIRAAVSNAPSRAVAERLGFTEEGVLREAGLVDTGDYLDLVVYGLLDREWPERRAGVAR